MLIEVKETRENIVYGNTYKLIKNKGIVKGDYKTPLGVKSEDTSTADYTELTDTESEISETLRSDKDELLISIIDQATIGQINMEVVLPYSEGSKLIVYTDQAVIKTFDIGSKTGRMHFNFSDGEQCPEIHTINTENIIYPLHGSDSKENGFYLRYDSYSEEDERDVWNLQIYNIYGAGTTIDVHIAVIGNTNASTFALISTNIMPTNYIPEGWNTDPDEVTKSITSNN